eukprot:13404715-Alexandrium_andersonii.AAC.1
MGGSVIERSVVESGFLPPGTLSVRALGAVATSRPPALLASTGPLSARAPASPAQPRGAAVGP